ncbi:MAG: DUF3795 domain-containing protein [Candidatus Wallbacteria bacterium]|nr:DUF3795 domain-containing protein [Candidatus Wallbacteria bacterium]
MSKQKSISNHKNLLAYCGLYCGACSFRVAVLEQDKEHLRFIPDRYDKYKDTDLSKTDLCPGCRTEQSQCGGCGIRDCCRGKNLEHCGCCESFPCKLIMEFSRDGMPHHHEVLENIKRLKLGSDKWLQEEQMKWTCSCGARRSWYIKKCPKCGADSLI